MTAELRTFKRADLDEAERRWQAGRFSDEWRPFRHQAAMRGFIFPPEGDRFDSWEDDEPSQRAILIRAIRETPALLDQCIARSRSWAQVIALLTRERDAWREQDDLEARDEEWRRRDEPTRSQAIEAYRAIADRIAG